MPYRCEMCTFVKTEEFAICPQCGCDHVAFFRNPEIIRVEFHFGGHYVSKYKNGFFGYSDCRMFGEAARDMHRNRQFEILHPDDLTWLIRGCEGVKHPTLLNGKDVTGGEEILKNEDQVQIGSLEMKVVFIVNN